MVSIGPISTIYTNMSRQEYGEWLRNGRGQHFGGICRQPPNAGYAIRREWQAWYPVYNKVRIVRATDTCAEIESTGSADCKKTLAEFKAQASAEWQIQCARAMTAYAAKPKWTLRLLAPSQEDSEWAMQRTLNANCKLVFEVEPLEEQFRRTRGIPTTPIARL